MIVTWVNTSVFLYGTEYKTDVNYYPAGWEINDLQRSKQKTTAVLQPLLLFSSNCSVTHISAVPWRREIMYKTVKCQKPMVKPCFSMDSYVIWPVQFGIHLKYFHSIHSIQHFLWNKLPWPTYSLLLFITAIVHSLNYTV